MEQAGFEPATSTLRKSIKTPCFTARNAYFLGACINSLTRQEEAKCIHTQTNIISRKNEKSREKTPRGISGFPRGAVCNAHTQGH